MALQRSFFRAALLVMALPVVAPAIAASHQEKEALEDILAGSKAAIEDRHKLAGEVSESIQQVDVDMTLVEGWDTPTMPDTEGLDSEGKTPQQRAWNEIVSATGAMPRQYVGKAPPRPAMPDDTMYVFISLSMSEASIRELFLQAVNGRTESSVVFVLRGWEPPHLQRMVSRLNELFPEGNTLRQLPNLQINPNLFERGEVDVVPTYVRKDPEGVWRKLKGETSLREAERRIANNINLSELAGPIAAIEEPDILAIMQQRMAEHDWDSDVQRAKENVYKLKAAVDLPDAREDKTYTVDLTVRANQNLVGANNEVFARQGDAINPFDYKTLSRRYLFFNANKDSHLVVIDQWIESTSRSTLITTTAIESEERRRELTRKYGVPIHEADALLVRRFQLSSVPAIAYQDGRLLRVDVRAAE